MTENNLTRLSIFASSPLCCTYTFMFTLQRDSFNYAHVLMITCFILIKDLSLSKASVFGPALVKKLCHSDH